MNFIMSLLPYILNAHATQNQRVNMVLANTVLHKMHDKAQISAIPLEMIIF